jgi:O-antigen/teichoic acid export membrane protein
MLRRCYQGWRNGGGTRNSLPISLLLGDPVQPAHPPASTAIPTAVPTLGQTAASGFLWLFMQSVGARVGGLVSQLILASLLPPAAFGLFGLANTVGALAAASTSLGIEDILLQRSRTIPLWVSSAFWTSLACGVVGMIFMLIAAPVAAMAYGEAALIGLIAIMATTLPLGALVCVPAVRLRNALNFRFLGMYALAETLAVQFMIIGLAVLSFGAYSFVVPLPIAALLRLLVFWRKAPTPIRWRIRRSPVLYIASKGVLIQAKRLVFEATNQGDYIILGLLTNSTVVGAYFFAFRLAAQPLQMLAGNFAAVLLPALTQLRSQPHRQAQVALQAARVLAYIITPICFLQAALAAPLLHLLFGAKWNDAIPLMQIISIGMAGDATAPISAVILVARGEFKRDFILFLYIAVPFFFLVGAGAWLGAAIGAAIAEAIYFGLLKPLKFYWVLRADFRFADILHVYLLPPLLAGGTIGVAFALAHISFAPTGPASQMAMTGLVGSGLYLTTLRLFVPHVLAEIVDRLPLRRFGFWGRGRTKI